MQMYTLIEFTLGFKSRLFVISSYSGIPFVVVIASEISKFDKKFGKKYLLANLVDYKIGLKATVLLVAVIQNVHFTRKPKILYFQFAFLSSLMMNYM